MMSGKKARDFMEYFQRDPALWCPAHAGNEQAKTAVQRTAAVLPRRFLHAGRFFTLRPEEALPARRSANTPPSRALPPERRFPDIFRYSRRIGTTPKRIPALEAQGKEKRAVRRPLPPLLPRREATASAGRQSAGKGRFFFHTRPGSILLCGLIKGTAGLSAPPFSLAQNIRLIPP